MGLSASVETQIVAKIVVRSLQTSKSVIANILRGLQGT